MIDLGTGLFGNEMDDGVYLLRSRIFEGFSQIIVAGSQPFQIVDLVERAAALLGRPQAVFAVMGLDPTNDEPKMRAVYSIFLIAQDTPDDVVLRGKRAIFPN